jgi:cytochrome c6|tara:strand:+ start:860 stop:1195 length:336 start_codon:yes stop_codon:yes gene_type:complete
MKLKENYLIKLIIFVLCIYPISVKAKENEIGKKLFNLNCIACHKNGQNVIIPEKNLKQEALEENGMANLDAIIYQILNGKNGMPAFGGRLNDPEIEQIAKYVLKQSTETVN